jgi:hypothetical protein
VELSQPLLTIGNVLGNAEWLLRCTRLVQDGSIDALLFHLSATGVLAHSVISEHVQQLCRLASLQDLLTRAANLFAVPVPEPTLPALRIAREVFDAIWIADDASALEARLLQAGAPNTAAVLAAGLAHDFVSPAWKGGISKTHYPQGHEPAVTACVYMAAGQRTWLADPETSTTVVIREASRDRFFASVMRALEPIPHTQRRFV